MKPSTIQASCVLAAALIHDEGETPFTEGTPEYAILDALMNNDEVSNEMDRRLNNPLGTQKMLWKAADEYHEG
jgi:hypothetical protein